MRNRQNQGPGTESSRATETQPVPGKRTLVQRVYGAVPRSTRSDADAPAVQRRGAVGTGDAERLGGDASTANVERIAAEGTTGAGKALPHLDWIQAAFGGHDVRGIQAHSEVELVNRQHQSAAPLMSEPPAQQTAISAGPDNSAILACLPPTTASPAAGATSSTPAAPVSPRPALLSGGDTAETALGRVGAGMSLTGRDLGESLGPAASPVGRGLDLWSRLSEPDALATSDAGQATRAGVGAGLSMLTDHAMSRAPAEVISNALQSGVNGVTARQAASQAASARRVGQLTHPASTLVGPRTAAVGSAMLNVAELIPENTITTPFTDAASACTPERIISGGMSAATDLGTAGFNALTGDHRTASRQMDAIESKSFNQGYTPVDQSLTWLADAAIGNGRDTTNRILDPTDKSGLVQGPLTGGDEWFALLNPGYGASDDSMAPAQTHSADVIERPPTTQELVDYCADHGEDDPEWCNPAVAPRGGVGGFSRLVRNERGQMVRDPAQLSTEERCAQEGDDALFAAERRSEACQDGNQYGPLTGRLGTRREHYSPWQLDENDRPKPSRDEWDFDGDGSPDRPGRL